MMTPSNFIFEIWSILLFEIVSQTVDFIRIEQWEIFTIICTLIV